MKRHQRSSIGLGHPLFGVVYLYKIHLLGEKEKKTTFPLFLTGLKTEHVQECTHSWDLILHSYFSC